MDKYQNKYRIPTNRLSGFDYGSQAFYFVTICTQNKAHYFGEIISHNVVEPQNNMEPYNNVEPHNNVALQMTEIGKIAFDYWMDIPNHYPFVIIDEFVIMPNHIHGILYLNP